MYVILHSLTSIDGRIEAKRFHVKNASRLFEGPAARIDVDAWIVGRTTMQEFSSKRKHRLGPPDRSIKKTDYLGRHSAKTFAVVIDPSGKCRWDSNMVTTEHVIEVLTERVSTAYLKHLRDAQVSYVFAGRREIDLRLALRKLEKLFGVRRCRVDGGGRVNGSFLRARLVDEISHVIVPVADGSLGTPTMFDAEPGTTRRWAEKLRLKSLKKLPGGVLWLRYVVPGSGARKKIRRER